MRDAKWNKELQKINQRDGKGPSALLPSRWRDGDDGSGDAVQRMETRLTRRDDAGVGNGGERVFASLPLARDRLLVMEEDERKNNASLLSFPLFAHADALASVQLIPIAIHAIETSCLPELGTPPLSCLSPLDRIAQWNGEIQ